MIKPPLEMVLISGLPCSWTCRATIGHIQGHAEICAASAGRRSHVAQSALQLQPCHTPTHPTWSRNWCTGTLPSSKPDPYPAGRMGRMPLEGSVLWMDGSGRGTAGRVVYMVAGVCADSQGWVEGLYQEIGRRLLLVCCEPMSQEMTRWLE
jgi:hypothetical protein